MHSCCYHWYFHYIVFSYIMCLHIYIYRCTPYHTSFLLCTHNIIHTYTAIVSITTIVMIISQRLLQGTTIIVIIIIKMSLLAYIYICMCFIHTWMCLRMGSVVYPQVAILRWNLDDSPLEFGKESEIVRQTWMMYTCITQELIDIWSCHFYIQTYIYITQYSNLNYTPCLTCILLALSLSQYHV